MKTLNYLADFWQKANSAIDDIIIELPKVAPESILKPIGTSGKMWLISSKDLGNKWGVEHQLLRHKGESKNILLLCDKVKVVFRKSPDKVSDFLIATANKGFFVVKGCFKGQESTVIKLEINELARLRLYVKENTNDNREFVFN